MDTERKNRQVWLWHSLFIDYANLIAGERNLSDYTNRLIFACKCIGFLDCMFERNPNNESYKYLQDKVTAMIVVKKTNR